MDDIKAFLQSWAPGIDADDLLRQQGADPFEIRRRSPSALQVAQRAVRDGADLVTPLVLQRRFRVHEHRHEKIFLSEGHLLSGPLLARYLAGAAEVVAVVCSIGSGVEARSSETLRADPAYAVALDEYGTLAVTSLASGVSDRVREVAAERGEHVTMPLNPGLKGWPVGGGQQQLFRLLDGLTEDVTLTASSYMVPRKSTSFVLGVGRALHSDASSPCDCCSLGSRCSYRSQSG